MDMSCENQLKFCLFSKVSLNGELILQPKQPVSGENSLCGVFYFVAVPVCGDELEDKAKNFKCIVFNADSKEMQFVPFLTLHLSPQSTKKQSDSCNINWDTAHKTARSFFLNPVYKEYAFKNVTEEECKVLKVLDPHTEQQQVNLKGRALWARGTKKNAKRDADAALDSVSPESLSKRTRNPSRKLIDIAPCPQTPKLPVTPSPQPPKPKTAGKPKKNSTTQKGRACKSERVPVFNLDKATAENSPSLESSLDESSKLDKLLSLVENMNARIQTLFFFERSAAATKALR